VEDRGWKIGKGQVRSGESLDEWNIGYLGGTINHCWSTGVGTESVARGAQAMFGDEGGRDDVTEEF
jgi:hypothetical protein